MQKVLLFLLCVLSFTARVVFSMDNNKIKRNYISLLMKKREEITDSRNRLNTYNLFLSEPKEDLKLLAAELANGANWSPNTVQRTVKRVNSIISEEIDQWMTFKLETEEQIKKLTLDKKMLKQKLNEFN